MNRKWIRGDTKFISKYFYDKNGNILILNPSTDQVTFTVKKDSEDQTALLKKNFDNGVTISEDGKCRITIESDDTQYLELGKYGYDIEVRIGVDEEEPFVQTIEVGTLKLTKDYTKPTDGGV